jgi:cytochrome c biogenesis protein CcdA
MPQTINIKAFAVVMLAVVAVLSSCQLVSAQQASNSTPQYIYFFYENGCHACDVAVAYIQQVEENYTNLKVYSFEIHNSTNYDLMMEYYNAHNINIYTFPVVFIGNHILAGDNSIEYLLEPLLDNGTGTSLPQLNSTNPTPQSPPLLLIVGFAFADSLNPCAISVLLILIAFAAVTGGVWKTGISYILGNFVAYLLIGVGLFTVLSQFNLPEYTSKVLGALSIFLAVYTLYSKLPGQSRPTIKKLIQAATSPVFAFFAGAAISAIELPCTGGPYILALTLVREYNLSQLSTIGYLLLYNTIFVLPLVAVLLAYHFANAPSIPKKYIRWVSAFLMFVMGAVLLLI